MNKVLIVDDHPVIRLAVRMLMERHGYDVVAETDNGVAALQLTRQHLPDIVVLDIGIPKLDGTEVIARMATFSPGSKVLVLTSQPRATSRCAACRRGRRAMCASNRNSPSC